MIPGVFCSWIFHELPFICMLRLTLNPVNPRLVNKNTLQVFGTCQIYFYYRWNFGKKGCVEETILLKEFPKLKMHYFIRVCTTLMKNFNQVDTGRQTILKQYNFIR